MPLPPDFADRFAIGDDELRSEATDTASRRDLELLIERVTPRFDAINAYLDEHDDEDAHELGRLAECAAETVWELERRPS